MTSATGAARTDSAGPGAKTQVSQKRAAVQRGGPEFQKGTAVLGSAVAGMALQPVARVAAGKATDQRITAFLRKHTGGRDRQTAGIPAHHGALAPIPGTQGKNPIHQHQFRGSGEFLKCPQHRQLGGGADAMAIDFGG
jgi:hypothetical protein